jgi:hypothetical protein
MKRQAACLVAATLVAAIAMAAGVARGAEQTAPPAPPQLVAAATVREAHPDRLVVENEDDGMYTVIADRETVVEKNGDKIALRDIQVGDRVVVEPRTEPEEGRAGQTIDAARILVLIEVAH